MGFGAQFWIQIIAYAVSIGALYGSISTRLKYMEKKIDVHNRLVERMYNCESRLKVIEKEMEQ